jgi:hypothetical protein
VPREPALLARVHRVVDLEQLGRLGSPFFTRGNISECTMPAPAVSHCTSPWPKRAVAPSESEWSMSPLRTSVTVSKPWWGVPGEARHLLPVVHAPAVLALEVLAEVPAVQRGLWPQV